MIDIKFNSEHQIIYVTFTGTVNYDDIHYYIAKLRGLDLSIDFLDIIHDMRKIDYQLTPNKIDKVLEQAAVVAEKYKSVRVASVHHNAHSTAISTIIRERIQIKNVEYRVYSTLEVALEWLKTKKFNQQVG